MDGDPAVESRLDSFSLTFPLPYRVGFLIVAGVWGWGVNLHALHRLRIDVPALIHYPPRASPTEPSHHLSTYRLATLLSGLSGLSILIFWAFTRRDPKRVIDYDWIPILYLLTLAVLFIIPLRHFSHAGRRRFLGMLRRVSLGGIANTTDGRFGDVILADALTSYSKVMGDLYVTMCMFTLGKAATDRPDRGCGGSVAVPLIMAIPSAIRLRQCLIEFSRVRRGPYREATGWGGQHLANALKYASAFPVIILSALQRNVPDGKESTSTALHRAWIFAMLFNSVYSWYWDVSKDWDLTLFAGAAERNSHEHPYGLRRRMLVGSAPVYYFVIAMDLVLRCTWVIKLNHRLDKFTTFESAICLMQFLEVFRRWVWIFFRVEAEWLRGPPAGPNPDDVLLGDYHTKYDEED